MPQRDGYVYKYNLLQGSKSLLPGLSRDIRKELASLLNNLMWITVNRAAKNSLDAVEAEVF